MVAVDDWALRKGRTYGTIVVDLERRRVLDLLPDCAAKTLADWLRARPGTEVVARDRSTEYARAITLGAPAAVQIADRWHLLANMRQVLERWLAWAQARLRRLLPPGSDASPDTWQRSGRRTGPFLRSAAEMRARAGRRERRIALYEEVRRRCAAAETLLAIGRAVGLAVNTVRKYAAAESFPVPEGSGPGPASWIPTSPTCKRNSPKAARAPGCSGARCAPWASQGRTSRCNAGSRSTGPHPPPRRPDRASYPRCPPRDTALVAAHPTPGGAVGRRCRHRGAGRAGRRDRERRGPGPPLHRPRARLRGGPQRRPCGGARRIGRLAH
jgi:hypothetical protein